MRLADKKSSLGLQRQPGLEEPESQREVQHREVSSCTDFPLTECDDS